MGYNPFRWYTSGKYRKRPLNQSAPLLLKIKNGDFEYSPFYKEAKDNHKMYDTMYDEFMNTSAISDINLWSSVESCIIAIFPNFLS